jgi:uncharacterized protein (TIGR00251 family)
MRIRVQVKANASKSEIVSFEANLYKITVAAPAKDGKANLELVKFLKRTFCKKLHQKKIRIVSGANSRIKIVEIV